MQDLNAKIYGRTKTRSLTKLQNHLFQTELSKYLFRSFDIIDKNRYDSIFLEIGFGDGEHMAKLALYRPNSLFIGAEPFVNGVASLLVKIAANNIFNILIFPDDVRKLLCAVPAASFDGIFLLFPDPWPKRKHFKRRFIQEENIFSVYKAMKTSGKWRIATDHVGYAKWILKMFEQEKIKQLFGKKQYVLNTRPDETEWPKTKYERKNVFSDILFAIYKKK